MKPLESVRISWRAITSHKLRSTLTTLGVIIGVGAVIVFMVLGSGFEANILADIEDEDPQIVVRTQVQPEGGFGVQFSDSLLYTQSDIDNVSEIEGVASVTPNSEIPATQLQYRDRRISAGTGGGFSVAGSPPDAFEDGPLEVTAGDVYESGTNQAMVNEPLVEMLDGELTVGEEFTVSFRDGNETTFTVVGVVDDDTGGLNPPTVHVPLDPHYQTTVPTPGGTRERAYAEFLVRPENPENIEDLKQRIETYFEEESDARQLKNEDQTIVVQTTEDVIEQVTDIIDQLALFLGGIAAISLIVGSIGIANIMIVSVTERTREIGIMKAVGARRRDIMQLFLVESLILGVIGAVVGVLAGLGFGFLGVTLAGWPMAYPVDWIVIAVAVGLFVGVLSGLYPAWRAARVDPIEALRHE